MGLVLVGPGSERLHTPEMSVRLAVYCAGILFSSGSFDIARCIHGRHTSKSKIDPLIYL